MAGKEGDTKLLTLSIQASMTVFNVKLHPFVWIGRQEAGTSTITAFISYTDQLVYAVALIMLL